MVVVASGEPGVPVVSCALAGNVKAVPTRSPRDNVSKLLFMTAPPKCWRPFWVSFQTQLDLVPDHCGSAAAAAAFMTGGGFHLPVSASDFGA